MGQGWREGGGVMVGIGDVDEGRGVGGAVGNGLRWVGMIGGVGWAK